MLYLRIAVQDQSKTTRPGEVSKERKVGKRQTTIKGKPFVEKNQTSIADGNAEIIIDQVKELRIKIIFHHQP